MTLALIDERYGMAPGWKVRLVEIPQPKGRKEFEESRKFMAKAIYQARHINPRLFANFPG